MHFNNKTVMISVINQLDHFFSHDIVNHNFIQVDMTDTVIISLFQKSIFPVYPDFIIYNNQLC